MNYTDAEVPYTRIIEHKHFVFCEQGNKGVTVITREYPEEWDLSKEPYYPINDVKNMRLYDKYVQLARSKKRFENIVFAGRLGSYRYYDMDKVIEASFDLALKENLYRK